MIDKRIEFDERYDDGETTTLYFIAPKEMLYGKYPEAEHAEISVECPTDHIEARYASVEISPTKYFEEDDAYVDYDWFEVELPYDEIEELIALAKKECIIMKNKIANFVKESVEGLQEIQEGCCRYKLDDHLAIYVGWSAGYGNEKRDDVIQAKDDPDYGINVGIKVWTSDYMQTDFDWLNFPYYENGEVLDMSLSITPNDNYEYIAKSLLEWYREAKEFDMTDDGKILPREVEYDVFCFERTLKIKFSKGSNIDKDEILKALDRYYDEWQNDDNPDRCLEEFMIDEVCYEYDLTIEEWDSIPYGEDCEPRKTMWVCEHCLAAIESREGNQATLEHSVDETDAVDSKCDWCKECGFDTLYELI